MSNKEFKSHEYLRYKPFFWSRLGFCYDPPRADDNGNQIIFSRAYEKYRKFHKNFENADIKYHTTILHSGWVDDGVYDYRLTDETLDAILKDNPEMLYMPRVKLNAPVGWCKNHPEDVFVYEGFESSPEKIAERCGTNVHDWLGYSTATGYALNGGDGSFKDNRPNMNGEIGLQSFSSPQWLSDASEALRKLINHLNKSPYAKQIIGYHIAYGMCGETALWGGWRKRREKKRGDFGIINRKMFINYGLKKYKDEKTLLEKWGADCLDNIKIPSLNIRDTAKDNLRDLFYDNAHNLICLDYNEFISESNAKACETFCKVVKEETNGEAATGVFYGYMYTPQSAYLGYLAIDTVLNSPYVDFLASPRGYYRSLAGDPGGEQGPTYSINKKKVWLDEIDNHTHLDLRRDEAQDFFETRTQLLREGVKNLSAAQGFWWMDLGEGWYDTPEIMALIEALSDAGKQINEKQHKSISEILLVVDENSIKSMSASYGLTGGLLYNLQSELKLCGAPIDTLRLSDLYHSDISQYKMIVFANTFKIDDRMREILKNNAKNKTYVWNYAAGILSPDYSRDNVKDITGFEIQEFGHNYQNEQFGYRIKQYKFGPTEELELDFPLIEILPDSDLKVLSNYPEGKIMSAQKSYNGGTSVFCAFPSFMPEDFRNIAISAGCRMYAPVNTTVYADNRIIGIFPKNDVEFVLNTESYTINGKNEINLKIPAKGAEYFIFD